MRKMIALALVSMFCASVVHAAEKPDDQIKRLRAEVAEARRVAGLFAARWRWVCGDKVVGRASATFMQGQPRTELEQRCDDAQWAEVTSMSPVGAGGVMRLPSAPKTLQDECNRTLSLQECARRYGVK